MDKEVAKTVVDITGLQLSTSYQANCCRKWVGLVQEGIGLFRVQELARYGSELQCHGLVACNHDMDAQSAHLRLQAACDNPQYATIAVASIEFKRPIAVVWSPV